MRDMTAADLPLLGEWLLEPHVARWWSEDPVEQLAEFADAIAGRDTTHVLVVEEDGRPVGWAQWYRWADSPDEAPQYGASEHDFGIDYGIGTLADVGRGVGTELITVLVRQIRCTHPQAPILVAVATSNTASRRVLEKNGFVLVGERMIEAEPGEELTALYRMRR
ncbi:MAG: GNAT family N-acetyltransferase [Pseudonocardiales bacterium]